VDLMGKAYFGGLSNYVGVFDSKRTGSIHVLDNNGLLPLHLPNHLNVGSATAVSRSSSLTLKLVLVHLSCGAATVGAFFLLHLQHELAQVPVYAFWYSL